jgi:UDP-N-acetylmuramoyl-L-alanyl-D-glutamate--2,6-diaminopimelate ligase
MVALATLLPWLDAVPDVEVAGISDDSRDVVQGDVFVAVAGDRSDGHDHVDSALKRGAVAVLSERSMPALAVPCVVVPELKRRRGVIASSVLGDPSADLFCVGVTGTNGKTSVAFYLAELASALGYPTGYLGTIGWGLCDSLQPALLTTDSAINTQKRLHELAETGAVWVAMEVSSHALDQDRVAAVQFDVSVFTNLSRDHLDYHPSFEAYGEAKARLFENVGVAVINTDDAFGAELAGNVKADEIITYGRDGDIRWRDLQFHDQGVSGVWDTPWGSRGFTLPLFGEFAVANLSAVLTVLCHTGVELDQVVDLAAGIRPVPGRVELFPGAPAVVVDYAHTPDALAKVLATLRAHVRGRLICVIGCGGDRDSGKRPLMAAAAERGADQVWLTSDNPRSEDPLSIIRDMRSGLSGSGEVHEMVDRREAVVQAFSGADAEDVLLVAGKGHEDYQEIAGERLPFSDRQLVKELLAAAARQAGTGEDG